MTLSDIEIKRKRLLFRSDHRGMKEMDIFMGAFAREVLAGLSAEELDLYDDMSQMPDIDLYNWISGKEKPPADHNNPILQKLLDYKLS